jgi:hypothetical protein
MAMIVPSGVVYGHASLQIKDSQFLKNVQSAAVFFLYIWVIFTP